MPRIRSSPPLTGETAAIIRIVEDLPAPLGPRKANASPRRTSRSMPLTASTVSPDFEPNDLRRSRARIIASLDTRLTLQKLADTPDRRLLALLVTMAGPPGGVADQRGERRREEHRHHERGDEDAEGDGEPEGGQQGVAAEHERCEGAGQDQAGCRDGRAGMLERLGCRVM